MAEPPLTIPPRMGMLRALRSRNYRLYFTGQAISLTGSWMTRIATSWLVYRLSHSVMWLGVVNFVSQAPTLVVGPFAGVYLDRWNRHQIITITQALAMLQSFALAYWALAGTITVGHVVVLSLLQGIIDAIDMPARQSFLIEIVRGKEDLSNAIALNSSIFNGARLVGPSLAGLIIATKNEGWCFLIDGISYLAVLAALLAMRLPARRMHAASAPVMQQLREGIRYVSAAPPIRAILVLVLGVSLLGMPYAVLMPVIAKVQLHGGPHTFGFLMGAGGLGALLGALYLASRRSARGLERVITASAMLFGAGLMGFSFSRIVWVSLLLMVAIGTAMLIQMASCNTVLQTIMEDDKRGRVMSLYTAAFMGMTPLGSLLAAACANRLGAQVTIALGGAACVFGALVFARKQPAIRSALAATDAKCSLRQVRAEVQVQA